MPQNTTGGAFHGNWGVLPAEVRSIAIILARETGRGGSRSEVARRLRDRLTEACARHGYRHESVEIEIAARETLSKAEAR